MPAPRPHLTFPPSAADALSALDRQSQLHGSAFLASAARYLDNHPRASLDGCLTQQSCLSPASAPLRRTGVAPPSATPLCLLCAVDVAVERLGNGFPEQIQQEFLRVGTVVKQAVIDVLESNPDAAVSQVCIVVSSRLHTGHLVAETVEEITEQVDRLLCFRALSRANYRGAMPGLTDALSQSLTRRGWAVAGVATPQGRFALEQHKRAERRAASLRPARA